MRKQRSSSSKLRGVHPLQSDYLSSVLPAAILSLSSALSPADKEVLAYLISSHLHPPFSPNHNYNNKNKKEEHSPAAAVFSCDCFGCYTSYWARWDTSPNRHLIHHIIDAFELQQHQQDNNNKNNKNKKNKNRKKRRQRVTPELTQTDDSVVPNTTQEMVVFNVDDVASGDAFLDKGSSSSSSSIIITNFVSFIRHIFWGPS